MKQQLQLFGFSDKRKDVHLNNAKELFRQTAGSKDKTQVYEYLVENLNISPGAAICQIITWSPFKWETIWQQYEDTGQMTYVDFYVKEYAFLFYEDSEGEVYSPEGQTLLNWTPNDAFNGAMKGKIVKKIKAWVMANQYSFFDQSSQKH